MRASAGQLAEGLGLLHLGAAVFDERLRLVYCNAEFRRLRIYPEDVCGEGATLPSLLQFNAERGDFGPGDVEELVAERIAEIDAATEREVEREMADGQVLAIRYRRTGSGGLFVTYEDRSAERRAEARLMSSLATISDGILLVDAENRVLLWNDRYVEIFSDACGGADLSDVICKDRPFFDMIRDGYNLGMFKAHPDGVDAWVEARKQAWGKPVARWELELANGAWILLNERTTPDGGRVSVYTDITELKRREAEAEAARTRFEDAIESISAGFALFDADDRLVVWNSRFREYFSEMADVFVPGATFREMLGASIERGLFPAAGDDSERFLEDLLAKRAEGIGKVRENRLSDGLWLQIRDHRTRDGGLVSIYTDVTELKSREQEAQAARRRFEEAIGAISAGFVLWDADDRIITCNTKFREIFSGLERLTVAGSAYRELIDASIAEGKFPDSARDPETFMRPSMETRARGEGIVREQYMGDGIWLQITDHRTADGGLVSIYTDVTELKTREQEAQAARERFEDAIETISAGFVMWDEEDRMVVCNSRYRDYFPEMPDMVVPGASFADIVTTGIERGIFPGDKRDYGDYLARAQEIRARGDGAPREQQMASGIWLQVTDHRTRDGGLVSIYADVTELKRREEEMRRQATILEATLENMGQGITMVDGDLNTVAFNRKFFELMEFPEARFGGGFSMEDAFRYNAERGEYGPGDVEQQVRERVELSRRFKPHRFERVRPDGTVLEIVGNPVEGGGFVATYTDITERKRAEEAVKQREAELEAALQDFNAVLENIDYGVLFLGPDLRVKLVNPAFSRLWRIPKDFIDAHPDLRDLIEYNRDRNYYDVAPEDWRNFVEMRVTTVREGDIAPTEVRRRDGSVVSYQCVALADGGRMLTYFNITELKDREAEIARARDEAEAALADLKKAQERLIQAEKMASLGQLTAGIAHEIKNPLNFVNNFARLSDELMGELAQALEAPIAAVDEEARDDAEDLIATIRGNLGKINEHGRRADSIVKNMLLHSREGPSERQTVALNAIAEEALNLAYHGARAENPKFNIDMKTEFDDAVGEVECFPQDLMRVFLNLISNGMYAATKRREAEGDGFSPEISISTRAEADGVAIEIRDNGAGIPPEARDKIFLPFFTTKPAGEGTGLGLSLSYDIIAKQHGGELKVESEPQSFTAFRVALRRALPAEGKRP